MIYHSIANVMQDANYNTDVNSYSLDELFGLFGLTTSRTITMEEMKTAKKKVLMSHPDKSKLPPKYFLFYKKAFDIVFRFFENQNKQNQPVNEETTKYDSSASVPDETTNTSIDRNVKNAIQELSPRDFQEKFNQLFEKNMYEKPSNEKNDWFSKDEPVFVVSESVNTKNMASVFDKIKEKQNSIVAYRGVENIASTHGSVGNLYAEEDPNKYVESDVFSKLKYDDLRKVHKDQTVFAVSERDFEKVPQYMSVEHFIKERGNHNVKPMAKPEAEKLILEQNNTFRENIMRKEYAAELKLKENAVKTQAVLSHFLQLRN